MIVTCVTTFQIACEGVKEYQMKFKVLKITIVSLIFTVSGVTSAGLINVDVFNDGTNKGFTLNEPGYNLEWMDFGQTQGYSYNQVISMTRAGGIYQGWRIPNQTEMVGMLKAAIGNSYSWVSSGGYVLDEEVNSEVVDYWYQLADIFGTTTDNVYEDTGVRWFYTDSVYEGDNGLLLAATFSVWQHYEGLVEGLLSTKETAEWFCTPGDTACVVTDYRNIPSNVALVRQVSEPAAFGLFGLALLAVLRLRRRK